MFLSPAASPCPAHAQNVRRALVLRERRMDHGPRNTIRSQFEFRLGFSGDTLETLPECIDFLVQAVTIFFTSEPSNS
jgi:hypothetical protein